MADNLFIPSKEDIERGKDALDNLDKMGSSYANLLRLTTDIHNSQELSRVSEALKAAETKRISNSYTKQVAELRKIGVLTREEAKKIRDLGKEEAKRVSDMQKQQNLLSKQKHFRDDELKKMRTKLGLVKEEAKTMEGITKEVKKQAKEELHKKRMGEATQVTNVHKQMEDVSGTTVRSGIDALGDKFGPIGKIVTGLVSTIASFIAKTQQATATILKASAVTGEFSGTLENFSSYEQKIEDIRLSATQIFRDTGLSWKEMTAKMAEAAGAGILLSDALDVKKMTSALAASNALGISFGQYAQTLVKLRRTMQDSNDVEKVSEALRKNAQTVARADIMNTSEFIGVATSMADEFSELNYTFEQTANLTKDLMVNVKNLGVTSKVARDITEQLTKSFKSTTDEWKSFIGASSGAGGGFLGGLFSAQQRGPGGDLLTREADPRIWLKQVQTMIQEKTSGFADPRARTYMAEALGKSAGLDPKTTQALLKGITGDAKQQSDALDEMIKASAEAEEKSKDWAERLAPILEKMVSSYLKIMMGYLKVIAGGIITLGSVGLSRKGKDLVSTGLRDLDSGGRAAGQGIEEMYSYIKGDYERYPQKAGGGTVMDTGLILAHREEEVLSPQDAKKYRENKKSGSMNGGLSLNVTVNIQNDINKAFEQAKQETYRQLKKSNQYAWGM